MAFALLFAGVILLVTGVRNSQDAVVCLLKEEFTGTGNFFYWVIALLVFGSIGYVDKLKPLSDSILLLVILALLFSTYKPGVASGFFDQFQAAVESLGGGGSGTADTGGPLRKLGKLF